MHLIGVFKIVTNGGHIKVVKFLVENHADLRHKSKSGHTALDYARLANIKKIVTHLESAMSLKLKNENKHPEVK